MFGFTAQRPQSAPDPWGSMPGAAPWGGLPTATAGWPGSEQVWQPAQQAPWRLSPWSTQGMPAAAPVQPIAQPSAAPAPNPYLPQGMSGDILGFNPMTPGGGFAPAPPPAPPQAPPPSDQWSYGGFLYPDQNAAAIAQLQHMQNFQADPGGASRRPENFAAPRLATPDEIDFWSTPY